MVLTTLLFSSSLASAKVVVLKLRKASPVYKEASFDSRVMVTLKKGFRIYGIEKPRAAKDGFGLFHKVRLKKKIYGYIPDTAVEGFKKRGKLSKKSKLKDSKDNSISKRETVKKKSRKNSGVPLPYQRAFGGGFSQIAYQVKTSTGKRSSNELFLNFKVSNTNWGRQRIPLDVTVLLAPNAPALFDPITQDASGYMTFLDITRPFEWRRGEKWSIYYGVGLVVSHFSFTVRQSGTDIKSGGTDLGISGTLGGGYRVFSDYLLKFEGSYKKVGTDQIGVGLSLQKSF